MEVFETFKSALNHRVSLAKVEEAKRRMQKHLKATQKHLAEIKSVEFGFSEQVCFSDCFWTLMELISNEFTSCAQIVCSGKNMLQ